MEILKEDTFLTECLDTWSMSLLFFPRLQALAVCMFSGNKNLLVQVILSLTNKLFFVCVWCVCMCVRVCILCAPQMKATCSWNQAYYLQTYIINRSFDCSQTDMRGIQLIWKALVIHCSLHSTVLWTKEQVLNNTPLWATLCLLCKICMSVSVHVDLSE